MIKKTLGKTIVATTITAELVVWAPVALATLATRGVSEALMGVIKLNKKLAEKSIAYGRNLAK